MNRRAFALGLGLLFSACSSAPPEPPAPPPFSPVGTYGITIDAMGMQMGGTMVIEGAEGAFTGILNTEMGGVPMSEITLNGQVMNFMVSIPEATLAFQLTFEGDEFTGGFDGTIGSGSIYGKKR